MNKTTFGVIVGNRGFFPDSLAKTERKDILDVLKKNSKRCFYVHQTKRRIHWKISVPWVVELECDIQTTTKRPSRPQKSRRNKDE